MLFRSNDTATTEIYTLSLHDALPIWSSVPDIFCSSTSLALFAPGCAGPPTVALAFARVVLAGTFFLVMAFLDAPVSAGRACAADLDGATRC